MVGTGLMYPLRSRKWGLTLDALDDAALPLLCSSAMDLSTASQAHDSRWWTPVFWLNLRKTASKNR